MQKIKPGHMVEWVGSDGKMRMSKVQDTSDHGRLVFLRPVTDDVEALPISRHYITAVYKKIWE